jgi:hypothetical protein
LVNRSILWEYDKKWKNLGLINKVYAGLDADITGAVLDNKNITWFFKSNLTTQEYFKYK